MSIADPFTARALQDELPIPALAAYLSGLGGDFSGAENLDATRLAGGLSNRSYVLRWAGRSCVLRRPPPPPVEPGTHDMRREHRLLSVLHPAYPLAPRVLHLGRDRALLGHPFLLMEHRRGSPVTPDIAAAVEASPSGPAKLVDSLMDAMASLHRIPLDPSGLGMFDAGGSFLARHLDGLARRWDTVAPPGDRRAAELASRLAAAVVDRTPKALIHNDFKLANVLIDLEPEPAVVAVVDWELATVGDPLVDLGMTLAYWEEPGDPDDRRTGLEPVSAREGWPGRAAVFDAYRRQCPVEVSMEVCEALGLFQLAVILERLAVRQRAGIAHERGLWAISGRATRLLDVALSLVGGA